MTTPGRRPQPGPPPPADGAAAAIRTARARRQRARLLAGGGLAVVAVAALALATVAGARPVAQDRLDQATAPFVLPSPGGSLSPEVQPTALASAAPDTDPVRPRPTPVPDPGSAGAVEPARPAPGAEPGPAGRTPAPRPSAYRTPGMTRTYVAGRAAPAGATVCGRNGGGDSGRLGSRLNWCLQVSARPSPRGHVLSLEVCRDDSGPGALSYADALETDLAVLTGDGREVWRWSADHPAEGPAHRLDVRTGWCFAWSVDWTDVDRGGARLPAGSYELVATTLASELQDLPTERTGFTVS